jgi:glycogen operon protein
VYGHKGREAEASVNFVTCHDGFSLNDLVSYDRKHNESNGEESRDGADDNRSWNCGVEGPTDDPQIEALRARQVKNFLTLTLLSFGMPMILMGDEMRRTQRGNNNAYCRDDEGNWLDWSLLERHADIHRFVRLLIERRLLRDQHTERQRATLSEVLLQANPLWHGVQLLQPDWGPTSHSLAVGVELPGGLMLHLIVNAYWEALEFELPDSIDIAAWRRWIDTSLASPDDIVSWPDSPSLSGPHAYLAAPRSVVVLWRQTVASA